MNHTFYGKFSPKVWEKLNATMKMSKKLAFNFVFSIFNKNLDLEMTFITDMYNF